MFDQQRRPRSGKANPERMRMAFWEWMIRGDVGPPEEDETIPVHTPYRAREHFGVPFNGAEGPIWTFDRYGQSRTPLPDGRVVCIGGEHEDYYDPDFHIYNDVVVFTPAGQLEIYGYPKDVFPPTDFHTATLVGDRIVIVGRLGYPDDRRAGHTPVHALDTTDYRISTVETSGEMPGWLWEHETSPDPDGVLTIRRGEVFDRRDDQAVYRQNFEDYALDLRSGVWRRLTSRNWAQYRIRRADDKWFPAERGVKLDSLWPQLATGTPVPVRVDWDKLRFEVAGVGVVVTLGHKDVGVVVESNGPDEAVLQAVVEVWVNTEAAVGHPCRLDPVA